MSREDWQRCKEIFQRALELESGERAAFLSQACAEDPETRSRVEQLLEAHQRPLAWLAEPVLVTASDLWIQELPTVAPGRRIGPFEITSELGRGGAGEVYLARRVDDQYHQQVAIKLIRSDVVTDRAIRRFRRERQILADLEHPNVARLLGGDVTPEGMPYLVMEYIEGEPIDAYCEHLDLSIVARLELFRQVCSAVQYAHRHLVVHCDLKPSNVLITREGDPKLLDFGIARLLAADVVPRRFDASTNLERWRMTPQFASPEQIRGERLTAASDVYSLGVTLYQLLTGHLPYTLEDHSPQELHRVVCEQQPERPSVIVEKRLRRLLTGDLDNVVMMALRKNPARRYASVEQLSEDLRRHLTGLPVNARKDTLLYRSGKFVRRHRWGVAAATAVLLALLVGLGIANLERTRAEEERTRAETVASFLSGLFQDSDSSSEMSAESLFAAPGTRAARELLLDEGARRVPVELSEQPELQAELMHIIGDAYRNLGSLEKAETQLQGSLEIRRRTFGVASPQVAASLVRLCLLHLADGDLEDAEARCEEALAIRKAAPGFSRSELAESLNSLALVLQEQGRLEEAEALLRENLRLQRLELPELDRAVTTSLNNLAVVLQERRSFGEAESLLREVLARKIERYGTEHLQVVNGRNNLASLLQDLGASTQDPQRTAEAESLYRQALETARALSGEAHPLVATVYYNLGTLLLELERYTEAGERLEAALHIDLQLYGEEHPDVARDLNSLAFAAYRRGELADAEAGFRRAVELYRRTLGESHPSFRGVLFSLVTLWLGQGRDAEARPLLEATLRTWQQAPPPETWAPPQAAVMLGGSLLRSGRLAEAETWIREGHAGLCTVLGAQNNLTRQALSSLIDLYTAWGKADQAERYRGFLEPGVTACPDGDPPSES